MIESLRKIATTYKETGKLADMSVQPLVEGIGTDGLREWVGVLVDDVVHANHNIRVLAKDVTRNRTGLLLLAGGVGGYIIWQGLVNAGLQTQINELRNELNKKL